jgi:hypothetical protein
MAQNDNTEIVEETTAPEGAPQGAPEGEQGPALSLEELNMLMQIVDLAVQRGAFRGNEISQVGAVYDKLNAFLGAVAQANQPAEGEAPEEEAAPVEE